VYFLERLTEIAAVLLETAVEIAVFLDDRSTYDAVTQLWLAAVPAYVYLSSDGAYPKVARGMSSDHGALITAWFGQTKFVDGLEEETCRDLRHAGYGVASIAHFAETAWIQGNDYYTGDVGERLLATLEFHSKYVNQRSVPDWLCKGDVKKLTNTPSWEGKPSSQRLMPSVFADAFFCFAVTEVGLNALGTRLGRDTSETKKFTQRNRPFTTDWLFVGWETLTHASNPAKA
jgi:hypothetical protein